MRFAKSLLGLAIMLAVTAGMPSVLRLTDDIAFRLMMLPVFFALVGLGFALMWFNGRPTGN